MPDQKTHYLIMGSRGEYDDFYEYPIASFSSSEEANDFAALCNLHCEEISEKLKEVFTKRSNGIEEVRKKCKDPKSWYKESYKLTKAVIEKYETEINDLNSKLKKYDEYAEIGTDYSVIEIPFYETCPKD